MNEKRTLTDRLRAYMNESESPLDRDDLRVLSEIAKKTGDPEARLLRNRATTIERDEKQLEKLEPAGQKSVRILYNVLAVVIALVIIATLILTVYGLPSFGGAQNPTENEVVDRYLEKGLEEGGATNLVANMILDYRAFDTLGESNVLFIAACSVIILLRLNSGDPKAALRAEADDRTYEPKNDIILQAGARVLMPIMMLYGMYIVLNGHLGPGGGFSGGAVMGVGLVLYLNAFGFKKTERFFTFRTFRVISLAALSFYALSKAYSFFTGANHLESIITNGHPGDILSAGLILPLNIAVGLVVCCTMYAFYTLFRKGDM